MWQLIEYPWIQPWCTSAWFLLIASGFFGCVMSNSSSQNMEISHQIFVWPSGLPFLSFEPGDCMCYDLFCCSNDVLRKPCTLGRCEHFFCRYAFSSKLVLSVVYKTSSHMLDWNLLKEFTHWKWRGPIWMFIRSWNKIQKIRLKKNNEILIIWCLLKLKN